MSNIMSPNTPIVPYKGWKPVVAVRSREEYGIFPVFPDQFPTTTTQIIGQPKDPGWYYDDASD